LPDSAQLRDQLLSSEAVRYTERRLPELAAEGRAAEPVRLVRNMLSSQPLCFSLFGHFDAHRAVAAGVLDAVLPWSVEEIEDIVVEHAPIAAAERLGGQSGPDHSAFDAMLLLRGVNGRLMIGVETKYTEPFSRRRYEKASYTEITDRTDAWFLPGAAAVAAAPATNQLWRNLMLAQESSRDAKRHGAVVVLTVAKDRGARTAVAGMRGLLKDPDARLCHVLLEDVIAVATAEPSLADWAARFSRRYLDLSLAAPPTA